MSWNRRTFLGAAVAGACLRKVARPAAGELATTVDLDVGISEKVTLCDGQTATVRVMGVKVARDPFRSAIREARVELEVNGKRGSVVCSYYRLPVPLGGVQVDCPFTRDFMDNANSDAWALKKQVRLRFWPAGSPWMPPGSMIYPVRQRWFASLTQMANEPVYVDGGEVLAQKKIYYHYGLDIGGAEGMVEVVAATGGVLAQVGKEVAKGHEKSPVAPRYDVLYLVDERGWYYRYSHLYSFAEGLKPGDKVRQGQLLGLLGKEGASGGWSHLHFQILSRQPSGEWGTHEGYAYLWEAYVRQYKPDVLAVARPHHLAKVGDKVRLDGTRSWARSGRIARYEWSFTGGGSAKGPIIERVYTRPGTYSEMLKVTDNRGHSAWDFAAVQVVGGPAQEPPTIHAAYHPTQDLRAGQTVTFKVRSFRTKASFETIDFGDGSAPATVKSDGAANKLAKDGYAVVTHAYAKPGVYIVNASHTDPQGYIAVARLCVEVG